MTGLKPSCNLEKQLFDSVEQKTPDYIKNKKLIDWDNPKEFVFRLKREYLYAYDPEKNPDGMDLYEWLKNYKKEAQVSTAGIRGPQNILYPTDTRFPINAIGIMLATIAKALASKQNFPDVELTKIVGREVRYNSEKYLELIARIQAAQGIKTLTTTKRQSMPIWMASFLAFKLDLLGGEYITSSHGISVKNATKDLNSQGSQYLPEESMEFVDKIKEIFEIAENKGFYDIPLSANDDPLIDEKLMNEINNGITLYKEYLQNGVAKPANIALIKEIKNKIIVDNVGGCAYKTLSVLLDELEIAKNFDWLNVEEDPFFHSIGKSDTDPKGNKSFYDYSVDATVIAKDETGKNCFPVIKSLHYDKKLTKYPIGTVVLVTDPDHDRLSVCQIESALKKDFLNENGIDFIELNGVEGENVSEKRILSVFSANQSFLLIMDFWTKQLKQQGLWDNHPRFIIKTTASAKSWDEWAKVNDAKVVNVPVGFKEIANIMKKVEKQISDKPDKDVIITDVFGAKINLGVNPRVIFAGEESGGMIIGAEELIKSKSGRIAIAMREKSASEAIIIAASLVSWLEKTSKTLSQYLLNIFEENKIIAKFDTRVDINYYNESESDIEKLKLAKIAGEAKRTKNDLFFLTLALAKFDGIIKLDDVRQILAETFLELDFSNLKDIKFVGDGTYLEFDDKFIEIRPSGTDAKTKAYGAGNCKDTLLKYATMLGNYNGGLNETYKGLISCDFYDAAKDNSMKKYLEFASS